MDMNGLVFGVHTRRRALAALTTAAIALSAALFPGLRPAMSEDAGRLVSVIVRAMPGAGDLTERLVERAGGVVGLRIPIIGGFEAGVPAGALPALRGAPTVLAVTPNAPVRLQSGSYDPSTDAGSMVTTERSIKARQTWHMGWTGAGVDVALIDSGVVPTVNGLSTPGKVVFGPDISFDSQNDNLRYLDAFGHGTHLAGIIAGRDDEAMPPYDSTSNDRFLGVAPDSRIVSVKVANAGPVTDVSQVLAAIDWVVQHRNDNGLNIRVLNLSFGTDGVQDYRLDPLTYAAEVAWAHGIVVVVSAGNSQFGSSKLNNPAYDPFVIAVGANDTKGTYDTGDDQVPSWSAQGDGVRNPDLVAPGKSIVSLRVPNSNIDQTYPTGFVSDRFFRGSGTSQAAAVVSGAAAVLLQQRPELTPDQVKALLTSTATPLPTTDPVSQGAGELNLRDAVRAVTPANSGQPYEPATGTGSLELARGSVHVVDDGGNVLSGEQDIFGTPWDGQTWSGQTWSGQTWSGGTWNGQTWSGQTWSGQSWSGQTWSGQTWSGQTWSGQTWSGQTWSGQTWSGQTWSGQTWSGQTWSGQTWSGQTWSGQTWSGQTWSGASWGDDPGSGS